MIALVANLVFGIIYINILAGNVTPKKEPKQPVISQPLR